MRRRMFREPQWSENDSPEAKLVLEGWRAIQADATKKGGEWDALVAHARRFPFELAQKVVMHFEALRKNRWKLVEHPGKLAWSALTDPAFTFARFVNEAPSPTATSSPRTPSPAFEPDRRRRAALQRVFESLPALEKQDLLQRAHVEARRELGEKASALRLPLRALDKRNELLEAEYASALARAMEANA